MAFDDSTSVEVTLEASVDPDRLPLDLARRGLAQQSGTRYNSAMLETPVPLDASHLDEMYRVINEAAAGRATILVGTWAAATWAIAFYQAHGYTLVADRAEKDALLRRYWPVPERQIETSVVLRKPLAPR